MKTTEKILFYFIVSQPFINMTTSIMTVRHTAVTLGAVFSLFVIVICSYLIIKYRDYALLFLLCSSVIAINLVLNFYLKDPFYIFSEVNFSLKVIYYLVTLLALLTLVKKPLYLQAIIVKAMTLVTFIIGTSFWLAILTKTNLSSYTYDKVGYSGWFFSANELSVIVLILLGFIISHLHIEKHIEKFLALILLLSMIPLIGTKTALGGALIIISFYTGFVLFFAKGKLSPGFKISFIIIMALFFASLQYTPAITNTTIQTDNHILEKNNDLLINNSMINKILSSRQVYLKDTATQFNQASFIEKSFGLGYGGHYEKEPKLIEMDFFDLFFSYGFIGFSLLLLPLLLALFKVTFIPKEMTTMILQLTLFLILSISFLAGHVLFAPAVMTYVAILFLYLVGDSYEVP